MGALVVITDADGKAHELKVNSAGNFTLSGTLALPYTAKVVVGSSERAMGSTPSTGDCNSCHTQKGSSGAPGRIVLP
jgi:mono/diheme cytochrome c family protein